MTASYDELSSTLAAASLVTKSLLAPRGLWCGTVVLTTADTVTTTVTTTMWVVNSVLDDTTNSWANTLVAIAAGFTNLDILVLFVTDNAETCRAFNADEANFT